MLTVMARIKLSPLRYIEAGQEARRIGEFNQVTTDEELYLAFISFCEYMTGEYMQKEMYNRHGDDISDHISLPLILENFWLYADISRETWEKLIAAIDTAAICVLIKDAFEAQQTEGAVLGLYTAKMVTIIQQKAEKIEHSGAIAIEQITGMRVL